MLKQTQTVLESLNSFLVLFVLFELAKKSSTTVRQVA